MLKVLVLICTSIVLISADCPLSDDDCAARNVAIDLTFLIDGSSSISEANFTRVKEWILTAVNRFEPSKRLAENRLQVTVVQYSERFATELNSQLVQNSSDEIRASVIGIDQMKDETKTYGGLSYVTDRRSAREAAYKVLITMTYGKENDDRNTTAVEIAKGYFDLMAGVGVGKDIDWSYLLNDLTKGVGPFLIDDFITLDNITGNITNAVKPVCVGADGKCSIATDSTVSLDIFICVNGDGNFSTVSSLLSTYQASITPTGTGDSSITNQIRNGTLKFTGLNPFTNYTITVADPTARKYIIHVPSPINCSTKATHFGSTIAVTTSSPTLNTTASFVQPDTTPATSAISSTAAVTSAGSNTTVTRLVESSTLRSAITSTEETSMSKSISTVTSMHSMTTTEPHTSQIMVSASTKESLVATSCRGNQSGYTFPPAQPGLTTYSEEKCSNGVNAVLASILCSSGGYYDVASLTVSECRPIDSVISASFGNTTFKELDHALANVSALDENQVKQVAGYLKNISNIDAQNYSQKQITEVASIFSHLSEYYNNAGVTAVERVEERQSLVRSFGRISRRLDSGNTSSVAVLSPRVNVEVSDISKFDTPYVFNATFYEDKTSNVKSYPMTITIPKGALAQSRLMLPTLRVVSVGYRSSVLFPSEKTTDWVISSSIGDSMYSLEDITFCEPVTITSNNILEPMGRDIVNNEKVVTSYECVFWDFKIGNWSTEGCSLLSSEPVTCQCNHLTNFAILVSRVVLPESTALSIVTYIGVGLSILGLFLTLLTICLMRGLRKKYQMQILGNICLCLAIALTLFVSGVRYQVKTVHCSILTVFMHFFLLASWMWTAVYSYAIYRDVAQVMTSYGRMFKILYAACFGYGAPVAIVVLNAGITLGHIDRNVTVTGNATLNSSYRSGDFCWLRHYSLYFGFLLPVALLLLFNVVVYCIVIPKITCKIEQMQSTKSKRSIKQNVVTSICLATTMGLSWVVGYLMLVSEDTTFLNAMSWLFTITNSFQGVMIFYMTVIRTGEYKKLFAPPKTDLSVVSTGLSTTDDKN